MLMLLLGFILGALFVVIIQIITFWYLFKLSPKFQKSDSNLEKSNPKLPSNLSNKVKQSKFREETCQWGNICGAFLFQELRDANIVKKIIINKLNEEFKDLLLKKHTGQLLHQLTVRDYFLGTSLPQILSVQILNVKYDDKEDLLQEVTIGLDIDYRGGAVIAIDADLMLGKSAFLSVELLKLQGKIQLQFKREPFTHWSLSFCNDPVLEFRYAPEFQGRNISQLTTLIDTVIRKFIKRRHTLPHYKVRLKPLFPSLKPQTHNIQLYMGDKKLTDGSLEVDILELSRLKQIPDAHLAFCTLALTAKPWSPAATQAKPGLGPMYTLVCDNNNLDHGLKFQKYYDQDQECNFIVISEVLPHSSGERGGIMKGDIVHSINSIPIKSVHKAKQIVATSSTKFIVTVQRLYSYHIPQDIYTGVNTNANTTTTVTTTSVKYEQTVSTVTKTTDYPDNSDIHSVLGYTLLNNNINNNNNSNNNNNNNNNNESSNNNSLTDKSILQPYSIINNNNNSDSNDNINNSNNINDFTEDGFPVSPRLRSSSLNSIGLHDSPQQHATAIMHNYNPPSTHNTVQVDNNDNKGSNVQSSGGYLFPNQHKRTKYTQYSTYINGLRDKLNFNVLPEHNYLNIVLWCLLRERSEEVLIGHVNIPLSDISVECLVTSSSTHRQRYVLAPPDPIMPGMSKVNAKQELFHTQDPHSKPWVGQSLSSKIADFTGDILIAFKHTPTYVMREEAPKHIPFMNSVANAKSRRNERANLIASLPQTDASTEMKIDRAPEDSDTSNGEEADFHSFITITLRSGDPSDSCKVCYQELGTELLVKCKKCGLICHRNCAMGSDRKVKCQDPSINKKSFRPQSDEHHIPLSTRINFSGIESKAEEILLDSTLLNESCLPVANTSKYPDKPLVDRIILYREDILRIKREIDNHQDEIDNIRSKLHTTPSSHREARYHLSSRQDNLASKLQATAVLLLQTCSGLRELESRLDSYNSDYEILN